MIKQVAVVAALLGLVQAALAEDPTEKEIPTSPVTIYSGGFGVGGFRALNKELKKEQLNFLKLSFENTVYFKENIGVFFDADWFAPGNNFGADIGFDFQPLTGDFRPFLGLGVGAHYFEKAGGEFGNNFGPSGTIHVGFTVDLSDQVQMRMRVPYYMVGNEVTDHTVGMEVGFLFSGKFRHIKKLNYNR